MNPRLYYHRPNIPSNDIRPTATGVVFIESALLGRSLGEEMLTFQPVPQVLSMMNFQLPSG